MLSKTQAVSHEKTATNLRRAKEMICPEKQQHREKENSKQQLLCFVYNSGITKTKFQLSGVL